MTWVRFEPTVPVSERAKTVHALDRATTVIDVQLYLDFIMFVVSRNSDNFISSKWIVSSLQ
jgi:hypothetical protein